MRFHDALFFRSGVQQSSCESRAASRGNRGASTRLRIGPMGTIESIREVREWLTARQHRLESIRMVRGGVLVHTSKRPGATGFELRSFSGATSEEVA